MAGSLNKVMLLGNLGRDPEVRKFENGGTVVNFSIATTESYYDREKNESVNLPTDWHNISVRRAGLTTIAENYLKKGSKVCIEGKLRTRTYEKEGKTHYVTEVVADNIILLSSGGEANVNRPVDMSNVKLEEPKTSLPKADETEDDLPF